MIKRSFSEFSMQRAVSNQDIHKTLLKYETFYKLLNGQIADEALQLGKRDASSGLGPIFRNLYEALSQSYKVTQEFIKHSLDHHPIDLTQPSETLDSIGDDEAFEVFDLQNLSFTISSGRVLMYDRNGVFTAATVLSVPMYISAVKKNNPSSSGADTLTNISLSDIRRNLIASSTMGSSAASDTKQQVELKKEQVVKDSFVYALVLLPLQDADMEISVGGSNFKTVDSSDPDVKQLVDNALVRQFEVEGGVGVRYSIEKVKLSDVALISSAFVSVPADMPRHVSNYTSLGPISEYVNQLYTFVKPVDNEGIIGAAVSELVPLDLQKSFKRNDVHAALIQNKLDTSAHFLTSCKPI